MIDDWIVFVLMGFVYVRTTDRWIRCAALMTAIVSIDGPRMLGLRP
jgi:hypothetical protein